MAIIFTEDETTKLKAAILYVIERKHEQSGGNCGFSLRELEPILEGLEKDQSIKKRPTINSNDYFLTTNK